MDDDKDQKTPARQDSPGEAGGESGEQKAEESEKEAEEAATEAEESAEKAEGAAEEAKEAAEEVKETVEEVKQETKPESTAPTPAPIEKEEPKKEVKVSGKLAGIIKEIEGLTVLELADLVHALEQKFGVSAAAPIAVAAAGQAAPAGEGAEQETQTTFNVILADSGANKISVIKAIRELVPTLGLKEAKDLVDSAPKPVLQGVNKEASNEAKQKLETAGAKVELQ